MDIYSYIDSLTAYAIRTGLAQPEDGRVLTNRLLDILRLEDYSGDGQEKIADLELERSKADNTRRRAHSPEKVQAAKDERKAITEKIRPLREKVKRAEKIMEKSPHLYELLQAELNTEREANARARNKSKEWSR